MLRSPRTRRIGKLDFVLAGAQKSGTTALHYFLQKHPQITMGDRQEMHFFDDEEIFSKPPDYESLHRRYPRVSPQTLAGDCTPNYVFWEPAAARIARYHPAIKLVILLRNPVDRAFSHWNMQRHKKREPLDFLEALKAEPDRITPPLTLASRRFSYVARGWYSQQLERFFKLFPREQIKVVKFEQFRNEQRATLDSIFTFLGLKALGPVTNRRRNVVPYRREMTEEERSHLSRIFAEEIARLEELLGWDCSDWKER